MLSLRRSLCWIAVLFWFAAAARGEDPAVSRIPADVRASAQARVDNGENAGILIGVIDASGSSYFSCGVTDAASGRRPDQTTIFDIGSISKVFTTTVLARLAAEGAVSFDDSIGKYLPEGTVVPQRKGRAITLRDLATHMSGLPSLPTNFQPADVLDPYVDYTMERLYAFLAAYELPRDIGSAYEYANFGMGLLGQLLCRQQGLSYEEMVRKHITGPLGMKDTVVTLTSKQRRRYAQGYSGSQAVPAWGLGVLPGAGALRSSGRDMLAFLACNLGLGLGAGSGADAGDSALGALHDAMRSTHRPLHEAGEPDLQVAVGWHVLGGGPAPIVWHNGGTGGFRSFAGIEASRGVGVVVLTNSDARVDDLGFRLLDRSYPLRPVIPVVEVPVEILDAYAGDYELAPGVVLTIEREGTGLFARLTGQPRFEVYASSENEFVYRVVAASITFHRDAAGKVSRLVLRQDGQDAAARRLSPGESK